MKRFNYLVIIIVFVSLACLTNNCKKESPAPVPVITKDSTQIINLEINQFIWGGLNYWYLWVDSVPKLSSTYFQNDTSKWNTFLRTYTDHEKLFNDLLYKQNEVDKWSWIVDDYTVLEGELQGITKSMGFDFGLYTYGSAGTNVFGFVRYIYPNSPASAAGVKRGDIFIKIDDQLITTSNYQTLLNKDSYKLSFADIINKVITPNSKQANLTAVVLQENPVFLDTVYRGVASNFYKIHAKEQIGSKYGFSTTLRQILKINI